MVHSFVVPRWRGVWGLFLKLIHWSLASSQLAAAASMETLGNMCNY